LHHKTLRALTSPHSISSLWQETHVALDEISPSQTSMVTAMNAAPKSETPRIAKLLPFLCSHELAAKAASHLRRRLASSRQSGLWKQQSDHEPIQPVSHVVSHVSQASFLSESHQMETWRLKSPYFSSDTDSSPNFQVQSQGYTYTTCAECILDVAQKTARLQVWLWFCVAHGHSESGQFAHFARQGIKHQRHQVLLLRDTPTCGAALTSTMFHKSGALLIKLVSEQICLAFLGPDFKIAKLAATLVAKRCHRGCIQKSSHEAVALRCYSSQGARSGTQEPQPRRHFPIWPWCSWWVAANTQFAPDLGRTVPQGSAETGPFKVAVNVDMFKDV